MAITYQSSQTDTGTTELVITKPTSTTVGDLLIAIIHTQNTISTVPTGWNQITNQSTNGSGVLYLYYIIATSTEVAASNFTFTASGNIMVGGISRITGDFHSTPFAVFGKDFDISTTTPTYTATVTPNTASSFILFCVGSESIATASNYAITTSNPSWTEAFDVNLDGGGYGSIQCSMAYATRPEITATGDATVTLSSASKSAGIVLVIRPKIITTTTETISLVESIKKILSKTFTETLSTLDILSILKSRLWRRISKPTSTWTRREK